MFSDMFFIEFTRLSVVIKKINLNFTSNPCAVFFKSVLSNAPNGKILALNMQRGKMLLFQFVLFGFVFPHFGSFHTA